MRDVRHPRFRQNEILMRMLGRLIAISVSGEKYVLEIAWCYFDFENFTPILKSPICLSMSLRSRGPQALSPAGF